jgi:hypothetical protein
LAAWQDLERQLAKGILASKDLHVESAYRSAPLPGWLKDPWRTAQAGAGGKVPVLVFNMKGTQLPDTLCVVRLADLEQLVSELHQR